MNFKTGQKHKLKPRGWISIFKLFNSPLLINMCKFGVRKWQKKLIPIGFVERTCSNSFEIKKEKESILIEGTIYTSSSKLTTNLKHCSPVLINSPPLR